MNEQMPNPGAAGVPPPMPQGGASYPPPYWPPAPKKKSRTGLWVAIGVLGLLLVSSFLLNLSLFGMVFGGTGESGEPADEKPSFVEKASYGTAGAKVVRIPLKGIITRESVGGLFGGGEDMAEGVLRQIRAATVDDEVRAIILEVDSPGGELTPSDEIYKALRDFRDSREHRRIVAFVRDLAASGGYYTAVAADEILAEPTAIVGSIGVIMQSINFSELVGKIGLRDVTIKSGENKDLLNPFQPTNPEHVQILKKMIDSAYDRFLKLVAERRSLDLAALRPLADGRVLTADEALDKSLIDGVGYWDDAMRATREQLGTNQLRIVRYEQSRSLADLLFSARSPVPDLKQLAQPSVPRRMYLWQP